MRKLTYANTMSTIAVFVALGGTSYAVVSLPRNSVGSKQIRSHSVGSAELKDRAVRSRQIRNRSIALHDISRSARSALRGQTGPTGPPGPPGPPGAALTAAVAASGGVTRSIGGAVGSHATEGVYDVRFNRNLRNCYATASLSRVLGGGMQNPPGGEIVTDAQATDYGIIVTTRNSAGQLADRPFHLIVVC